jgi:hypothetical protein
MVADRQLQGADRQLQGADRQRQFTLKGSTAGENRQVHITCEKN